MLRYIQRSRYLSGTDSTSVFDLLECRMKWLENNSKDHSAYNGWCNDGRASRCSHLQPTEGLPSKTADATTHPVLGCLPHLEVSTARFHDN
jgi:hypothetical protein